MRGRLPVWDFLILFLRFGLRVKCSQLHADAELATDFNAFPTGETIGGLVPDICPNLFQGGRPGFTQMLQFFPGQFLLPSHGHHLLLNRD